MLIRNEQANKQHADKEKQTTILTGTPRGDKMAESGPIVSKVFFDTYWLYYKSLWIIFINIKQYVLNNTMYFGQSKTWRKYNRCTF